MADCIAIKSYFLGKDPYYKGPFARGAAEAGLNYPGGGKHDDITVTVGQLFVDRPNQERRVLSDIFRKESKFVYTGEVRKALPKYEQDWIKEAKTDL